MRSFIQAVRNCLAVCRAGSGSNPAYCHALPADSASRTWACSRAAKPLTAMEKAKPISRPESDRTAPGTMPASASYPGRRDVLPRKAHSKSPLSNTTSIRASSARGEERSVKNNMVIPDYSEKSPAGDMPDRTRISQRETPAASPVSGPLRQPAGAGLSSAGT